MKKFSDLLHSLLYAPQRSVKQAYLEEFIKNTKDPDRGFAISALTGELSIPGVKTHLIRQIAYKRCDPLLFDLSYDFVGDLAETVALIWPTKSEKDISSELCRHILGYTLFWKHLEIVRKIVKIVQIFRQY